MAHGITIGRFDGGFETITPVGTTRSGAPVLTGAVNACPAAAALPARAAGPIVVLNTAGTATALTVVPPTSAGKINNGSAGASVSVSQGKSAVFYPMANGVDYVAVISA
jgi:hypothetical protein